MNKTQDCPYREMFEAIAEAAESKNIELGDLAIILSDGAFRNDLTINKILTTNMASVMPEKFLQRDWVYELNH